VPLRDSGITLDIVTTSNTQSGVADGKVQITANNAAAPIIFSVVDLNGVTVAQNTGNFTELKDGIYTARIYDYFGCGKDVTFRIVPESAPVAQPYLPACSGMSPGNGQILMDLHEGVGPFNITIGIVSEVVPGPTHVLSGLVAGSYVIFVADALSVRRNYSVTIPSYEFDVAGAVTFAPPVSAEGGTVTFRPNSDVYYEWQLDSDTSIWETPATIFLKNVPVGTRTLTSRDSRGCQRSTTFTIPNALSISLNAVPSSGTYCGKTKYVVTASVSGAPGPLKYRLSTDLTWRDSNSFPDISPPAVTIIVRYITPFGDYEQSSSIALDEVPRPGAFFIQSVFSTPASPSVSSISTISLLDEINDPFVHYIVDGEKYTSSSSVHELERGQHSVVAVDSSSCVSAPVDFVVRFISTLSAEIVGTEPSCNGQITGVINVDFAGGLAPIVVLLDDEITPHPGTNRNVQSVSPGNHKVKVQDSSSPPQTIVFADVFVSELPPSTCRTLKPPSAWSLTFPSSFSCCWCRSEPSRLRLRERTHLGEHHGIEPSVHVHPSQR
jgi:hypothetical protein